MVLERELPNPRSNPTEEQRAVITYEGNRNVGVIAGPGSGKTFVIMNRIQFLLNKGVLPSQILISTFTRRAISEIKSRINANREQDLVDFEYSGTIHSICKKLLEEDLSGKLKELGRPLQGRQVKVFEEKKRKRWVKEQAEKQLQPLFRELRLSYLEREKALFEAVKHLTDEFLDGVEIRKVSIYCKYGDVKVFSENTEPYGEWRRKDGLATLLTKLQGLFRTNVSDEQLKDRFTQVLNEMCISYQEYLEKFGMFDFVDLLIFTHKIFEDYPETKEEISSRFRYILVDEFQDINELQLKILLQLSNNRKNMLFVGDFNQAIYGFQGAYPDIFKKFKNEIDRETQIFKLSKNFRCTKTILSSSQALIKKNPQEDLVNEMSTDNPEGVSIYLLIRDKLKYSFSDKVSQVIRDALHESQGVPLNQIAVISRSSHETKELTKQLRSDGIKALNFNFPEDLDWDSSSKYWVCVLSLLINKTEFALEYIFSFYSKRKSLTDEFIQDYGTTIIKALLENKDIIRESFPEGEISSLNRGILQTLKELQSSIQELTQGRYLEIWDSASRLDITLFSDEASQEERKLQKYLLSAFGDCQLLIILHRGKWEGVDVLAKSCIQMKETLYSSDEKGFYLKDAIRDLINYVKLWETGKTDPDYINVSSVHRVKGCEFEHVFVLNLIEGRFPIHYAIEEGEKSIEEERRVLYVAMTRAKKNLYLVCDLQAFKSLERKIRRKVMINKGISRFLKEDLKVDQNSSFKSINLDELGPYDPIVL